MTLASVARRRRGRPVGWRAIPPPELEERVARARGRLRATGRRPTQRAVAEVLGISERTFRAYAKERALAI